jgi:hypothetical protein
VEGKKRGQTRRMVGYLNNGDQTDGCLPNGSWL